MSGKSKTPDKVPDLLEQVRAVVAAGKLRYSKHANQRMSERGIIKPEIEQVLKGGHRNKSKDALDEKFNDWNYVIEGITADGRKLRIVVALIDPNVLVVTTIDLDAGD